MYWTVYNWRQLISGEVGLEKSWQKLTKNWGAGAGLNKSWRQQDEENSGWWKYMKMLKLKLKANQIQVITCDNCLHFQKKRLTNINLSLFNNEKQTALFSIVIWLLYMKSELFIFFLLWEAEAKWREWAHQKLKKTWQGGEWWVEFRPETGGRKLWPIPSW